MGRFAGFGADDLLVLLERQKNRKRNVHSVRQIGLNYDPFYIRCFFFAKRGVNQGCWGGAADGFVMEPTRCVLLP